MNTQRLSAAATVSSPRRVAHAATKWGRVVSLTGCIALTFGCNEAVISLLPLPSASPNDMGDSSSSDATDATSVQAASDTGSVDEDDGDSNATACDSVSVANIPGLALWLTSDTGTVANGVNVTRWADQSGNGNDASQPTQALQPLLVQGALNGHSVVRFGSNGTRNALQVADTASLQWGTDDFVIEMVVRYTNTTGNILMYSKQQIPVPYVGAGLWGNQSLSTGSGIFAAQVEYQSGYFASSSVGGLNDGMARLYGARRTGGTHVEARINGMLVGAQVTPTVVDVSAVGIPISLGLDAANQEQSQQLVGDIAEVVAVRGTVPTADVVCFESYLITKYAL